MSIVINLHKKYIKGTEKKAIVQVIQALLCQLTHTVMKDLKFPCNKVYVNTRSLKHTYDKRSAEEYDFLVVNLGIIVKFPDAIYKNKDGKRGSHCFVKKIKNKIYLCSLEIIKEKDSTYCEVATFFRTDENYLKNCELLWEWNGGNIHRNAFDSGNKPA